MSYLVDTNVILDIVTEDPKWFTWSSETLERCLDQARLWINPIIYAEVSIGFSRIEDLDLALPPNIFRRAPMPWGAGFLAGKCFHRYRQSEGQKTSPLPDFYIGAHAALAGFTLITRDQGRFKTYFPKLEIISPPSP